MIYLKIKIGIGFVSGSYFRFWKKKYKVLCSFGSREYKNTIYYLIIDIMRLCVRSFENEKKKGENMFGKKRIDKKKIEKKTFDRERQIPILKCSICTGEQVAGFKDIHTGKFEEIMLIRNEDDLEIFKKQYEVESIAKEY